MLVSPLVLATMLDAVGEGVYHADLDRRIVHWNAGARLITGYDSEAVVGCRCQDRVLRHVDHQGVELCDTPACPLLVPLRTGRIHQAELYLHHREGHLVPVSVRSLPHRDPAGQLTGVTQTFTPRAEGSSPRQEVLEWRKAALTDSLTGLGNRRTFRLAWARAHRALVSKGVSFGLLMVDIDHFKRVNDTHGHALGDRVLRMVARTLAGCVRQNDTVVRWGGEEFLILVPRANEGALADLAERVRQLVERSWVSLADGGHLAVTVSVGGSLVQPEDRPADLVARADERLYRCKAAGRNRSLTRD